MISENSQQWDFISRASKTKAIVNSYRASDWKEKYQSQQQQMEAMQQQIWKLTMDKVQAMCSICYSADHMSADCLMHTVREEEVNFVNSGRRSSEKFNQEYNQNKSQHPAFQLSNP